MLNFGVYSIQLQYILTKISKVQQIGFKGPKFSFSIVHCVFCLEVKILQRHTVDGSEIPNNHLRCKKSLVNNGIHPRKLTCPLKRDYCSREYIFQPLISRGHVSFQGSKLPSSGCRISSINSITPKTLQDSEVTTPSLSDNGLNTGNTSTSSKFISPRGMEEP